MSRALLVTALNVADAGVVQSVVGRQVRAAGNPEYVLDALRLEAFHDGVDGSHDGRGPSLMGGETPAREAGNGGNGSLTRPFGSTAG